MCMDTTTAATTNSPQQSTGSTPESLRARFALIQQSAAYTNASGFAAMLRWDNHKVDVVGTISLDVFLTVLMALRSEAASCKVDTKRQQYSILCQQTASLADDIADWHNHCDDDSSPSFLDAAQEIGVSR